MKLSKVTVNAIREMGLDIGDEPFFVEEHRAYPSGYIVFKPVRVPGNGGPEFQSFFTNYGGQDDETDAPSVYVFYKDGAWRCAVSLFSPGPGPGEFSRAVESEDGILNELRNYFFGESKDFKALYDAIKNR
jgi:hypothetical protein